MADEIQRTIYKIEIEDSGYVRGIETLSLSTKKFEQAQAAANKTLQTNEAALKSQSEYLARTKKDLDAYTGSNEKYRQQLQKDFTDAETENKRLTALVNDNRKAYEAATKAADDFALTAQKASDLVQPSGKVPVPSVVPVIRLVCSKQFEKLCLRKSNKILLALSAFSKKKRAYHNQPLIKLSSLPVMYLQSCQ